MEHLGGHSEAESPGAAETAKRIASQDAFHYYRGLVGQIEIALPHHASRVLLFTSSANREGTTEVVMGVGLTLAGAMGRSTAIIDCNVRNPDIHRRFGVEHLGLDEYLGGKLGLEQALHNTLVPNLYIMPLGPGLTSLAALKKEQLAAMITTLRNRFEYVLLDSAPVGLNPETTILCDKVDAVIVVVKHGDTRREVVRRTKDMIERAEGNILGIVLNKRRFPIPEFLYRRL
jgi:capsular exopolysaccharide synthesis family protein